jgi:hypothetical protein
MSMPKKCMLFLNFNEIVLSHTYLKAYNNTWIQTRTESTNSTVMDVPQGVGGQVWERKENPIEVQYQAHLP